MARKPIGDEPMTGAERQRRRRARQRVAAMIERERAREAAGRERLRRVAPDLVDDARANARAAADAWDVAASREVAAARDASREKRRVIFNVLRDFVQLMHGVIHTGSLLTLPAILEVEEYEAEFRQYFRGGVAELLEGLAQAQDAARVAERLSADLLVLVKPRRGRLVAPGGAGAR
jgi:hypothetical protein